MKNLYRPLTAISVLVWLLCSPALALAQNVGVAAIVNDSVITSFDLESRIKLALISARVPDTGSNRAQLLPQVIRSLVDETLQTQEAKRLSIKVDDKEIDATIAALEARNNFASGGLLNYMQEQGVPASVLRDQIRANLAWGKVVRTRYLNNALISESEIRQRLADLGSSEPQYLLAELVLSFDNQSVAEATQAASDLADQLRQGANFGGLARAFSSSASARDDGDLGWVRLGQLPPEIAEVLPQMRPGQIAGPIKTKDSVTLIWLRDVKENQQAQLNETITMLPVTIDRLEAENDATLQARADGLRRSVSGCESLPALTRASNATLGAPINSKLSDVAPQILTHIRTLQVNDSTILLPTPTGFSFLTVCQRTVAPSALPTKAEIRERLALEKLDRLARSYLRDLKQNALIEIRRQ